jgi:hypothetical protein
MNRLFQDAAARTVLRGADCMRLELWRHGDEDTHPGRISVNYELKGELDLSGPGARESADALTWLIDRFREAGGAQ